MKRISSLLVAAVLVSSLPIGAAAQLGPDIERRFAMRVGVGKSDNLRLQSTPAAVDDSTFQTVGVDIGAERETARLRAFSGGSLDYFRYEADIVDSNTSGSLSSGLDVKIAPAFVWRFGNDIGHIRRDPFRAVGPENQERIITFSSGPDLTVPFGSAYTFAASARYADRQWEDTETLDSTQRMADISVFRALSSTQRVGVSLTEQDTVFDTAAVPGYEAQTGALTYGRRGRLMDLTVSGGRNRLRAQGTSESKPYFDAVWTGRPAPRSSLVLRFTRRYEDAIERLVDGRFPAGRGEVVDAPLASVAFDSTQAGLSYRLDRGRAQYSLTTERSRERFEVATQLDRERVRNTIGFRYQISPIMGLNLRLRRGSEEYADESTPRKDRRVQLDLTRQLNRTWNVRLGYEDGDRRSSSAAGSFDETRYSLTFMWSPVSQGARSR